MRIRMRRSSLFGGQNNPDGSTYSALRGEEAISQDDVLRPNLGHDDDVEAGAGGGSGGGVLGSRRSLQNDFDHGVCTIVKGRTLGTGEFGVVYQGTDC